MNNSNLFNAFMRLKQSHQAIFALFLIGFLWTTLLVVCKTLTSGNHLTDNHEIITSIVTIRHIGLIDTLYKIISEDLWSRFRPLYYFDKILQARIFGFNFFAASIYNLVLAILTSSFLFQFLFKQGYAFLTSLLFPFVTLIGEQSAIWCRLGPAETTGFFLLSASLFFLVNSNVTPSGDDPLQQGLRRSSILT